MNGADSHEPARPAAQFRPPPPPPGAPTGTVEQRVARWAEMLDEAVSLLNKVMAEVKDTTGKDAAGNAE